MSQLLLVRHAQASFLDGDYDRLSELGRRQSRTLGQRWAALGQGFDRFVAGPRTRQRDTALECRGVLVAQGVAVPELEVLDALDEYPAEEILRGLAPELSAEHESFAELGRVFASDADRRTRGRAFDKMLQRALYAWAEGRTVPGVESHTAFVERIEGALSELTRGSQVRVAAFSSAGSIGALLGVVLGTDARKTLELGWMLENASVSEMAFSRGRVGVARVNTIGHLPDPATWTRR